MPMGRMIKAENCAVRSRLSAYKVGWQLIDAASLEKLKNDDDAPYFFSDSLSCAVPQLLISLPRMPTLINSDLSMENGDLENKGCVGLLH